MILDAESDEDAIEAAVGTPPLVDGGSIERFVVRDERSANWFVRRIADLRRYVAHVEQWAASEIRQSQAAERHLFSRYGGPFEEWTREYLIENGGRRRSINLPAGTAGFRAQPARLVIKDEAAALIWCRKHMPEAIGVRVSATGPIALTLLAVGTSNPDECKVEQRVLVSVLIRHVGESGEIVPGTDLSEPRDAFYVK